ELQNMSPELLASARRNLKPAYGDLIDKFTAIRARNIVFGAVDPAATLNESDIQTLRSFAARSSPAVHVTPAVGASTFGGGTKADMVFRTTFRSSVTPGPPYRVIRFVRAAQVNRNFGITKEDYTVPGYVHYEKGLEDRSAQSATQQYVRIALMRSFI